MGASAKMDVDVTGFIKGMKEAGDSVKVINSQLKQTEAQMKLNGQSEQQLAAKATLLNDKLKEQQKAAQNAEQALKAMTDGGVDQASDAYQKMQINLANAQTAMLNTELEIQNLGASSTEAAASADQLSTSVQSIGKKISLDQIINGIDKITGGMEKAARKAIDLGKAIWENIVDTARYSDDIATSAMQLDMSIEDYQRYKAVFDTVGEITVQEWMKAKQKVQKAVNDPTNDQIDIFQALGLSTKEYKDMGGSGPQLVAKNFEDMFWEIGKTLQQKVESGQMTQDLADTYANAIFGKSFASLKPMFALGKEGFTAALEEITVASEDAVKKNAELNDQLIKLQQSYDALKAETVSALAPALETAAKSIDGLLGKIMEYLETPEGQQALTDMEKAVSGLFEDLGKIDPEQVVSGFADVFGKIVDGMQWISKNWSKVEAGIIAIGVAFGTLKVSQTVLNFMQLIQGFTGLGSGGSGGSGGTGSGAPTVVPPGVKAGILQMLNGVFGAGSSFSMMGGASTFGPLAAFIAAGYAGKKMIEANLNDPNLNAIYGTGNGENGIVETMSPEALKAVRDYWKVYQATGSEAAMKARERLSAIFAGEGYENNELGVGLIENIFDNMLNGNDVDGMGKKLNERFQEVDLDPIKVVAEPAPDAQAMLQEKLDAMKLTATVDLIPRITEWDRTIGGAGGGMDWNVRESRANGWPFVPYDGMLARLHKGEAVVPAREVLQSRNFSSNLYVESMYMNSGVDAAGLASAIAAANRRTMSGYGS